MNSTRDRQVGELQRRVVPDDADLGPNGITEKARKAGTPTRIGARM